MSIVFLTGLAATWGDVKLRVAAIELRQIELEDKVKNQSDKTDSYSTSIEEIKQSLVRIEGKLELKQDRFK